MRCSEAVSVLVLAVFTTGCVNHSNLETRHATIATTGAGVSVDNCYFDVSKTPCFAWSVFSVPPGDTLVSRTSVVLLLRSAEIVYSNQAVPLWETATRTFQGYAGEADRLPIMNGKCVYNATMPLELTEEAKRWLSRTGTKYQVVLNGTITTERRGVKRVSAVSYRGTMTAR